MSVLVTGSTSTTATLPTEGSTFYTRFTARNPSTATIPTESVKVPTASERVGIPKGNIGIQVSILATFSLLVPIRTSSSTPGIAIVGRTMLSRTATLSIPIMTIPAPTGSQTATSTTCTTCTFIGKTLWSIRTGTLATFTTWSTSRA